MRTYSEPGRSPSAHRLDAAYLELAQRTGLPLATLDKDLRKAAHAEKVALLEAAQMLGLSVTGLRILVKSHIVKEEEMTNCRVKVFLDSDLLVLRILAGMSDHQQAAMQ